MKNIFNYKVGFDLDDTIIDVCPVLKEYIYVFYKKKIKFPSSKEMISLGLTEDDIFNIYLNVLKNWIYLKPIPGAIEFLRKYYRETGNKLVFITKRSSIIEKETNEWLSYWLNRNIPFEVVFTNRENKSKYINNFGFDIFIDDNVNNVISGNGNDKFKLLLFERLWNLKYIKKYLSFNDWWKLEYKNINLN